MAGCCLMNEGLTMVNKLVDPGQWPVDNNHNQAGCYQETSRNKDNKVWSFMMTLDISHSQLAKPKHPAANREVLNPNQASRESFNLFSSVSSCDLWPVLSSVLQDQLWARLQGSHMDLTTSPSSMMNHFFLRRKATSRDLANQHQSAWININQLLDHGGHIHHIIVPFV